MAEEQSKGKGGGFLKKSKWGKLFKEDDSGVPEKQGTFKLNEDVVDFLRPSTEKAVPKLNIAVATRWPDAHEVRAAGGLSPPPQLSTTLFNGKPKRRKNLNVGFVRTPPEIIGEGGDEAPDPPSEISRMKAAVSRSMSDRKSGPAPLAYTGVPQWPPAQHPAAGLGPDVRPGPLRRVQTSHNEASPPVQRKHASPPVGEPGPHLSILGRTPTGLTSHDPAHSVHTEVQQDTHDRPPSRIRPTVDTHNVPYSEDESSDLSYPQGPDSGTLGIQKQFLGLSPSTPISPAAQKAREMRTNEGAAFRRASTMVMPDDDDDGATSTSRASEVPSFPQSQQTAFSALSHAPTARSFAQSFAEPPLSPSTDGSPLSPIEHNPFADPKFLKRRSRETASQSLIAPAQAPAQHRPTSMNGARLQSHTTSREPQIPHVRESQESQQRPIGQTEYSDPLFAPSHGQQRPSAPQISLPQPRTPPNLSYEQGYSQAMQRPEDSLRATPTAVNIQEHASKAPSNMHDFHPGYVPEGAGPLYPRANGNSVSRDLSQAAHQALHSQTSSWDRNGNQFLSPTDTSPLPPPSPRFQSQSAHPYGQHAPSRSSPNGSGQVQSSSPARGSSDTSQGQRVSPMHTLHSAAPAVRTAESDGPSETVSNSSRRPSPSIPSLAGDNGAADAAHADFAARVAHMRGVFSLTADREQPSDQLTPDLWLRSAIWWFLQGRAGLELLLQARSKVAEGPRRELLTQAHVDLAKTWWILGEPLGFLVTTGSSSAHDQKASRAASQQRSISLLQHYLKSASLAMARNGLLPPTHALIQGQNTTIWLQYPRFRADVAAILSGNNTDSVMASGYASINDALEMLTLGETRDAFYYGGFPAEAYLNTDDADTDRVILPCMLSITRGKIDYQIRAAIASQSDLVNVRVSPRPDDRRSLSWQNISWKADNSIIIAHLSRDFNLSIRMSERDFRYMRDRFAQARNFEHELRAQEGERLVFETRLVELQYAGASDTRAFPSDKLTGCTAFVYERTVKEMDSSGMRKKHRGYRLLLASDAAHKNLSSISHEICRNAPLHFEFMTDPAANGTTAMVLRGAEDNAQIRMLLVFPDIASRQAFYDVLNGLEVGAEEDVVGSLALAAMNIESAVQSQGFSESAHPALRNLRWHKLGVANTRADDPNNRFYSAVESETLRILAQHAQGCITDRMNLSKGELLLRLPCSTTTHSIQLLRRPQEDMTLSIDTRNTPQPVTDAFAQLLQTVKTQSTIRTFTFASAANLHAFQAAITGFTVRFDGLAASLAISRRRMVVPIYKKWEVSNVRIQIVSKDIVVQMLAFMDDFSHAETLCFRIKSTDVFENVKGGKGVAAAVRLVDAKFSLPKDDKEGYHGQDSGAEGVGNELERLKRRFVNLEGLEYAGEHDDITVGFADEAERDRFGEALPAATSVSRGITLKRRI